MLTIPADAERNAANASGPVLDQEPAGHPTKRSANQDSRTLLAGLVLGLAASYLLRLGITGPGYAVWLALLILAALWHNRDQDYTPLLLWSGIALTAALLSSWRATPVLQLLLQLVIATSAALALQQCRAPALLDLRLPGLALAALQLPWQALTGTWGLLTRFNFSDNLRRAALPGILRGTLLALPILLLFSLLFGSADFTFSRLLAEFGNALFPSSPLPFLLFIGSGWTATSLLLGVSTRHSQPSTLALRYPKLGHTETTMILGSMGLLFLGFVLLQLRYLFGGAATIESISGLTVAAHARRGFFELVLVAGLTLALLLGIGACTQARRLFQHLGLLLILCVLVMLASALQRLLLYAASFGLTLSRVVALAALVWIGCNLLAFAVTVLRDRPRGFALYLATSGITVVLLLTLANPVAWVARVNLERARAGVSLDLPYLFQLGAETVPPLLEAFDELDARQQCSVAAYLSSRVAQPTDWRHYNRGQARATAAIAAEAERLAAVIQRNCLQGQLCRFPVGALC